MNVKISSIAISMNPYKKMKRNGLDLDPVQSLYRITNLGRKDPDVKLGLCVWFKPTVLNLPKAVILSNDDRLSTYACEQRYRSN